MKTCFKIREQLLDYHFGELEGLEAQRVVSHLENCAECRAVLRRLGDAFASAIEWQPEPKPGEIDRLMERLAPYLAAEEPEEREGPGWIFGVGLALAAGLAAFMVYTTWKPARPAFDATPIAENVPEKTLPIVEEVVRAQPTEHLRVVASKDWNGTVRKSTANVTRVSMDSGFAVMKFDGGKGRKLIVETPDVEVEVIGTRFYVDARPGLPTTVGVVAGKVAVKTDKGKETLVAGTERAYGRGGKRDKVQLARSNPYHSDSYLLDAEPAMIANKPAPREKKRSSKLLPRKEPPRKYENAGRFLAPHPPDEPPRFEEKKPVEMQAPEPEPEPEAAAEPNPDSLDAARLLAEAERLVRERQYDAAVMLLEQALDTEDKALDPFRSMLRFERARILVKQGKREFARAEFGRLTQAQEKEVAHQARMSLCELELADDPCTAAACLRSIDSRESNQLLSRWRLNELDCAHNKNAPPAQPNR